MLNNFLRIFLLKSKNFEVRLVEISKDKDKGEGKISRVRLVKAMSNSGG